MQNSLDRLLAGLAQTLRTVVRPELADPYVRAQVSAAAELVENLATRVEWRSELLLDEVLRVRSVLERAAEVGGAAALPLTGSVVAEGAPGRGAASAALLEARARHLRALAEVTEWLARDPHAELERELRVLLAAQLDAERELLRGGMYRGD